MRRTIQIGAIAAIIMLIASLTFAYWAGFFNRSVYFDFPAPEHSRPGYAAVIFSGDLGFRTGTGNIFARALRDEGIPSLGVSSPGAFRTRASPAEVVEIVTAAIERAERMYDADHIIIVGHSFGADIAGYALPELPPEMRRQLVALILIVPTDTVFFRADPTTLSYHGTPDATTDPARSIDWLPVTCIRGQTEQSSLCPQLTRSNVDSIVLPGGHQLNRDSVQMTAAIRSALTDLPRDRGAPVRGQ